MRFFRKKEKKTAQPSVQQDPTSPFIEELYKAVHEIGGGRPLILFDASYLNRTLKTEKAIAQYVKQEILALSVASYEADKSVLGHIYDEEYLRKNVIIVLGRSKSSYPDTLAAWHEIAHRVQDVILRGVHGWQPTEGATVAGGILPNRLDVPLTSQQVQHMEFRQMQEFNGDVFPLVVAQRNDDPDKGVNLAAVREKELIEGIGEVKKLVAQKRVSSIDKTFRIMSYANVWGLEQAQNLITDIGKNKWVTARYELRDCFNVFDKNKARVFLKRLQEDGIKALDYKECADLSKAIVARYAMRPEDIIDTYNGIVSLCGAKRTPTNICRPT